MKKRMTAHLYSETKSVWKNQGHYIIGNDDGCLFSQQRYKTKIRPEDLPKWYVEGNYYRHPGYLLAKGVKHMVYQPNRFTNHMFKDDFLYISYSKPIVYTPEKIPNYEGYDEYIWGWAIPRFVAAAKEYSGYPTAEIEAEMEKKRLWLKETYPEFYPLEVRDDRLF